MKLYKKLISTMLIAFLILSEVIVCNVSATSLDSPVSGNEGSESAQNNGGTYTILKGVPILDGQVDEIYKQSLTLTTGVGENAYGTEWSDNYGTIYFLYSNNYLYICAEIVDDCVTSAGKQYVSQDNPYQNDCCEFRLSLNGGVDTIKVGVDAFGLRLYGLAADEQKVDYSKILYKTTYTDSVEDSGYVVEVAVPCTNGILDMLSTGKLGFKLQLNDFDSDGYCYFATSYNGEGPKGLVYYDLSQDVVSGDNVDLDSDAYLAGSDTNATDINYQKVSYNELVLHSDSNGSVIQNAQEKTIDASYCGTPASGLTNYAIVPRITSSGFYDPEYKYIRVLYSATNPQDAGTVTMTMRHPASWSNLTLSSDVQDTNGAFVLTDPCLMTDEFTARIDQSMHVWLNISANQPGGSYRLKAFYFFKTEEDAQNFELPVNYQKYQKVSYDELILYSDSNGSVIQNSQEKTFDASYCGTPASGLTKYAIVPRISSSDFYDPEYKYIRVLYSATNPQDAGTVTMTMRHPASWRNLTLSSDVQDTNGAFVLTDPCLMTDEFTARIDQSMHVWLNISANQPGGSYRLKAFYFFKTEEDARNFEQSVDYQKASYDELILNGDSNGSVIQNAQEKTFDASYCGTPASGLTNYAIVPRISSSDFYDPEYKYIRVLYAATNPEDAGAVTMTMRHPASWSTITLSSDVHDTNGAFALTDPCLMLDELTARLDQPMHVWLNFSANQPGGSYRIKAFYFFKTEEDAQNFDLAMDVPKAVEVKINGNDIANYTIIVPENDFGNARECAEILQQKIKDICWVELEIVTDSAAVGEYEIIVGNTSRAESRSYYEEGGRYHPSYQMFAPNEYRMERMGNNVVIVSGMAQGFRQAVEAFIWDLEHTESPIDYTSRVIATSYMIMPSTEWPEVTNVDDPVHFEDNFDADEGYWSMDSDKAAWSITSEDDNKVFSNGSNTVALSYLQVFEKNVSFETKWKYTAEADGAMSLLLRHTADDAYIKAGYDFASGEWFIDSREGKDFLNYRLATDQMSLTEGQWYTVKTIVDGNIAELYVDGQKVIETDAITQLTPGKIGILAESVSVQLDDVSITLFSGQGSIMKNVVHTKLPDEEYREGGSVVEMNDGSLIYVTYFNNASYKSTDSGKTWFPIEQWGNVDECPQILRLNNGNLLQVKIEKIGGISKYVTRVSEDDGETWTDIGEICDQHYSADSRFWSWNMNDKITQMSDGRIFYTVSYETSVSNADVNGCKVFFEIYYSDDDGVNWTKTCESFNIPGSEGHAYFSEPKIVETSTPGTLRLYSSWNDFPCIVYSESTDNGVTWGQIQMMDNFTCFQSSMNLVRDPYAENDTTYYMVWVKGNTGNVTQYGDNRNRPQLVLSKTIDGVNWETLGDVWRWENRFVSITQLVDPFIQVTEDYLILGSGISEEIDSAHWHNAQRQHIYSIQKSTLENEEQE